MEKIYGYKEKDIIGLAEFIKNKSNRPLSQVFESYAIKSNKAKGTVRNLYYAMAKLSNKDQEFCNKYLGGKILSVEKIVEFEEADESELIKKVLMGKKQGRSVRSVVMEMANGDGKIALRYQNKYRNAIKNKPEMVSKIIVEINGDEQSLYLQERIVSNAKNTAVEKLIAKIRQEINALVKNSDNEVYLENQALKDRISYLEKENLRLSELLSSKNSAVKILDSAPKQSLPS